MPLTGTLCCQTGLPNTFTHCQDCALKGSCVFPRPLIDEMAGKEESRVGTGISATGLLGCARQHCLLATEPYVESPANYHARWRGTGVHAMATCSGPYPGIIQERRIRATVETPAGSGELTGQPDWYDTARGHVEDWKSTKSVPKVPYDDHEAQVNIYAYLIERGSFDDPYLKDMYYLKPRFQVHTAAIRYIDPDRSVLLPATLWPDDYTSSFIVGRMEPIVRFYQTGELPAGIAQDKSQPAWKTGYCPFRGTGKCCADS